MLDLHDLIERYKARDDALTQQWWECCKQEKGNSTEAHMLWNLFHRFRYIVQDFQFAQEYKDLAWFCNECTMHERAALQELAPDWAENKPAWWLWVCRREAALYRLTRMAAARRTGKQSNGDVLTDRSTPLCTGVENQEDVNAYNAAFAISYEANRPKRVPRPAKQNIA